ncbi:hypothetical protein GGR56DRAFT_653339 [Xylariaceae sp. FL0804]|nr:hypothetical protein GGR56DRAFT_653339 [Xylariaceae sp. FL0804]
MDGWTDGRISLISSLGCAKGRTDGPVAGQGQDRAGQKDKAFPAPLQHLRNFLFLPVLTHCRCHHYRHLHYCFGLSLFFNMSGFSIGAPEFSSYLFTLGNNVARGGHFFNFFYSVFFLPGLNGE